MTTEEKINLLNEYNDIKVLSNEQFLNLKKFSFDSDSMVRGMTAALLVDFINEEAKELLLNLSQDEDSLVRTEAYDSLAVFPFSEVQFFLQNAIKMETDNLSRSYAILSWADVSLALGNVSSKLILELENLKSVEESTDCSLSYCYAMYILGNRRNLDEILSYLQNNDYKVRCMTIALLNEIIDETNEKLIKNSIVELLTSEYSVAVKSRAERFLKEN